MKKSKLDVPSGIRYMSQWGEFKIPNIPHIINKQIPGCGFTEFCITNEEDVILCSPRKILLQNKFDQHREDVYLVVNEFEKDPGMDKDLTKEPRYHRNYSDEEVLPSDDELNSLFKRLTFEISTYIKDCRYHNKPAKILVTYDSFRIVKDIVKHNDNIDKFRIVIDEFQSIFTDSKFKSDTEIGFVSQVQDLQKVCYVSATPMIEKYLEMIEEFKDLPYYELDWGSMDPDRLTRPKLDVKTLKSVFTEAGPIIKKYLDGKFDFRFVVDKDGNPKRVESREVVFYVNSVKNITSIVKRAKLKPEQVNILVANTPENAKRIRRLGRKFSIGRVPLKDEPRKMFTFCTRTVYLGADFYSDNAQTVIISDANIDTLAVDITLDLPQIMGRQRLSENPWKDEATLFFRSTLEKNRTNKEMFDNRIKVKDEKSESLLLAHDKNEERERLNLSEVFQKYAKSFNYKDNYVAVNIDSSGKLYPVLNKLVRISELRAFEIQQCDYADRFSVFNELGKVTEFKSKDEYLDFFSVYDNLNDRRSKLKYLVDYGLDGNNISGILEVIPERRFKDYIEVLGLEQIKSLSYVPSVIDKRLNLLTFDKNKIKERILSEFEVGKSYTKSFIKEKLGEIYKELGYKAKPKASSLEQFFELKSCLLPDNNKRVNGFKILSKK
jgi:hypothetical protein